MRRRCPASASLHAAKKSTPAWAQMLRARFGATSPCASSAAHLNYYPDEQLPSDRWGRHGVSWEENTHFPRFGAEIGGVTPETESECLVELHRRALVALLFFDSVRHALRAPRCLLGLATIVTGRLLVFLAVASVQAIEPGIDPAPDSMLGHLLPPLLQMLDDLVVREGLEELLQALDVACRQELLVALEVRISGCLALNEPEIDEAGRVLVGELDHALRSPQEWRPPLADWNLALAPLRKPAHRACDHAVRVVEVPTRPPAHTEPGVQMLHLLSVGLSGTGPGAGALPTLLAIAAHRLVLAFAAPLLVAEVEGSGDAGRAELRLVSEELPSRLALQATLAFPWHDVRRPVTTNQPRTLSSLPGSD
mmetsp:Transcript_83223/g.230936  ORF Transcript_83223/g.230936 Transcript_83223/m.230936 type:complete len:366 (-) Transcript_83223:54-1151(-)